MRPRKILTALLALTLALSAFVPVSFAANEGGGGVFYVDEEDVTDPGNTDNTDNTDNAGGGSQSGEKVDPSKDGRYYVNVALYHADLNQTSMGNVAFESQALVKTSGGKSVIQIGTRPVEVTGYTTAISEVEGATVIRSASFTTNTKFDGTAHTVSYPRVFELNLSNTTTEYIPVRIKVPYTPMDAVGAATDGWLNARIRIYWSSVTSASSEAELSPSTSVAGGASSLDEASAPAVSLSDSATGIKLTAAAGVVPKDATLQVKAVTSGADFTKAETALADIVTKFKLYDISLIQNKVAIQPDGTVTVSIPIPSDYDKAKVVVYRINDDGTATLIKGKVSGSNYEVPLSRLSLYALAEGLEVVNEVFDISKFTDIAGHWAYESIKYAVEHGLFNGTSETTFSPNVAMNRGMFVTVLGRIAGIDAAKYTATPFSDTAAGAYYTPYAAWASENGIVEGVGGGLFAPTREITRQEMATMLVRYASFAKISLATGEQFTFADDAAIASWAKDGVYTLAYAGLLNGVGENNYAPTKTATRAEVATVLTRFMQGYLE